MDLSKSWIACVASFINPLQSIEGNDVHVAQFCFEEDSRRVYVFSVIFSSLDFPSTLLSIEISYFNCCHFRIVDKRVDITILLQRDEGLMFPHIYSPFVI